MTQFHYTRWSQRNFPIAWIQRSNNTLHWEWLIFAPAFWKPPRCLLLGRCVSCGYARVSKSSRALFWQRLWFLCVVAFCARERRGVCASRVMVLLVASALIRWARLRLRKWQASKKDKTPRQGARARINFVYSTFTSHKVEGARSLTHNIITLCITYAACVICVGAWLRLLPLPTWILSRKIDTLTGMMWNRKKREKKKKFLAMCLIANWN